jgi:hypothetical protein
MVENRNVAVVTEGMITHATLTGDLQSLTMWAEHGVRITTARVRIILLHVTATLHLCGSW